MGNALGGGLELALQPISESAGDKTMVGFLKLVWDHSLVLEVPKNVSVWIGTSKTKELIFTARMVNGQEAYDLGILLTSW